MQLKKSTLSCAFAFQVAKAQHFPKRNILNESSFNNCRSSKRILVTRKMYLRIRKGKTVKNLESYFSFLPPCQNNRVLKY